MLIFNQGNDNEENGADFYSEFNLCRSTIK